jgi:hypothetical protein
MDIRVMQDGDITLGGLQGNAGCTYNFNLKI